mgnify:CR=1 FL=1
MNIKQIYFTKHDTQSQLKMKNLPEERLSNHYSKISYSCVGLPLPTGDGFLAGEFFGNGVGDGATVSNVGEVLSVSVG